MGNFKLYKKFYNVSLVKTGGTIQQNYTLLSPYSLSASTFVASTGATESTIQIENLVSITQESTGVYWADLDPAMYATDISYDLVWYVNYTDNAPLKKISTRFRLNTSTVTNQIEIEILHYPLEIEIKNNSLEIDIS